MLVKCHRVLSVLLCGAVISGCLHFGAAAEDSAGPISPTGNASAGESSYDSYRLSFADARPGENTYQGQAAGSGEGGIMLQTGDSAAVVFDNVAQGVYTIQIGYASVAETVGTLDYALALNGRVPFEDCENLQLNRLWLNQQEAFEEDSAGNQLPALLTESFEPQAMSVEDPSGAYNEPYEFHVPQGSASIEITCLNVPFRLLSVSLCPVEKPLDYAAYAQHYRERGGEDAPADARVVISAENSAYQSDKSITTFCDKTSAAMEPVALQLQVQNALGGSAWSVPGQQVTWTFEVGESGFYYLNFKARQDYTGGLFVSRQLYIDGESPFEEGKTIQFPYTHGWENVGVCDESGQPYAFYLSEGPHTLTLKCVLGNIDGLVRGIQQAVTDLNQIYLRIITITSTNPDTLRDYLLDTKIPEAFEQMKQVSADLEGLRGDLLELSGGNVQEAAILDDLVRQLERFLEDSDNVTQELSSFHSNISSLGTWVYSRYEQPLDLDYIEFYSPAAQPGKATAGFFSEMVYQVKQFVYSFFNDYTTAASQSGREITVWISAGRDQLQVFKRLIDNYFTPEYDIGVRVKLVNGALLQSVIAGIGPDVSVLNESSLPVNFAMRGALVDLKGLEGYDEVESRFYESAITPFRNGGGVYAIPESQNFPVLFYRKDIIEQLGIEVPGTWQELYGVLGELSINNMEFGMTGYHTFLFQNGGEVYKDGGRASGLDEKEAVEAFKTWTSMYTDYGLPVTFDFANRFRSGEMPMGIADYSTANLLSIFAPEIRGEWGMALVPGTPQEDGTINYATTGTGTGAIILKSAKDVDAAWEFVKWWTDTDAQVRYGTQIEDRLGASARYTPANIAAFEDIPWSLEMKSLIKEQWQYVQGIPEVPGGYYTARHLNNAFRNVVYQQKDAEEVLYEYVDKINAEIAEKRKEFGLD